MTRIHVNYFPLKSYTSPLYHNNRDMHTKLNITPHQHWWSKTPQATFNEMFRRLCMKKVNFITKYL